MTPSHLTIVRHAEASSRRSWQGPDEDRPLTDKGLRQAQALVSPLAALRPRRALTSPAKRCADTLAPLAATGPAVDREPLLAEGTAPKACLSMLLESLAAQGAGGGLVACSHGDVIDGIVSLLAAEGVALVVEDPGTPVVLETPKGGRWELAVEDGLVTSARLVGPPEQVRRRA